jgi:hypothetical protein
LALAAPTMNCCIFQDVAQMILATKALGLNLADALGAGRAGRKPSVFAVSMIFCKLITSPFKN